MRSDLCVSLRCLYQHAVRVRDTFKANFYMFSTDNKQSTQ